MLPIRNISYLWPMCCSFWEKWKNSPITGLGCSTPLMHIYLICILTRKTNIQSSVWATVMKLSMWVMVDTSTTHMVCCQWMRIRGSFGKLWNMMWWSCCIRGSWCCLYKVSTFLFHTTPVCRPLHAWLRCNINIKTVAQGHYLMFCELHSEKTFQNEV